MLWMRHETHDSAFGVRETSNVMKRTVWVHPRITEGDETFSLNASEGLIVGDIPALTVFQGNDDALTFIETGSPAGGGIFDDKLLVPADELPVIVSDETSWQHTCFHQDLETIADTQHRQPFSDCLDDVAHNR
jgi:hypothetical protein